MIRARSLTLAGIVLVLTQVFSAHAGERQAIEELSRKHFEHRRLASLLVEVRIDGAPVAQLAYGDAMTGVPATLGGHFRNGAVAITYVAAATLKLADAGIIDLDAPIAAHLPALRDADTVTPRMLLNMTAGYADYVADQGFLDALIKNPFHMWSADELIEISLSSGRLFEPGRNWDYSHSGYAILGRVLEAATGKPLAEIVDDTILKPLSLKNTSSRQTAVIPEPAIHAFSAERGIYEDSTYWNPAWTLPEGAVQVTTISDMAKSFDTIVGDDDFLGAANRRAMIDPALVGFGSLLEGCRSCHELDSAFSYGLGVFLKGDWVMQTPLFGGYASAVATLPAERSPDGRRVTIAVAVTLREDSYADWRTGQANWAEELARLIAADLVPANPPPAFNAPPH